MKADQLRRRYWLLTGGLFLLALALVAWLRYQGVIEHNAAILKVQERARETALNHVQTRLELTADMLADALVNPVYFFDLQSIEQVLTSALRQPDIGYAVVLDRHGRVLHDGRDRVSSWSEPVDRAFTEVAVASAAPVTQVSGDWMEADHPLLLGKERIGLLRLGLDLTLAREVQPGALARAGLTPQDGLVLALLALIFGLLAWAGERWLLIPVLRWRAQAWALLARDRAASPQSKTPCLPKTCSPMSKKEPNISCSLT